MKHLETRLYLNGLLIPTNQQMIQICECCLRKTRCKELDLVVKDFIWTSSWRRCSVEGCCSHPKDKYYIVRVPHYSELEYLQILEDLNND